MRGERLSQLVVVVVVVVVVVMTSSGGHTAERRGVEWEVDGGKGTEKPASGWAAEL